MPTVDSIRKNPAQESYTYQYFGVTYDPFDGSPTFQQQPPFPYQKTTSFRTGGSFDRGDVRDELAGAGKTWAQSSRSITRDRFGTGLSSGRSPIKGDTGHPFHTEKVLYDGINHPFYQGPYWSGPLIPRIIQGNLFGGDLRDDSFAPQQKSLLAVGVQGIRDTLPTSSPAGLAQALIELKREGLPKVKQSIESLLSSKGKTVAKGVGQAHLTDQFGVRPLLRDLQDALHVVRNSEAILKKYEDGVGKRQHRQRRWAPRVYVDHQEFVGGGSVANFHGASPARMGLKAYAGSHSTTDRRVEFIDYFKGAYVYHLPAMKHSSSEMIKFAQRYSYLTGMEPSVSLLWELTPWSWLSDWVFNLGDNIAVGEALRDDGLVLVYGYVMRETRYRATNTLYGVTTRSGETLAPVTVTYSKVTKERLRATPYGFGLNTTGFTARQWSILGALGLTKGSNSLHVSD